MLTNDLLTSFGWLVMNSIIFSGHIPAKHDLLSWCGRRVASTLRAGASLVAVVVVVVAAEKWQPPHERRGDGEGKTSELNIGIPCLLIGRIELGLD